MNLLLSMWRFKLLPTSPSVYKRLDLIWSFEWYALLDLRKCKQVITIPPILLFEWRENCWVCVRIYIYIYIYIWGAYNKFPDFFCVGILKWCRHLKIQNVTAIHLIRWLTNLYDSRFKWTVTTAIGIHPTKAWLSQLVNFKNAIWHFRRMICNKTLF